MKESSLQRKIIRFLQNENIFHYKTIVCSKRGIPDISACVHGRAVFIECKNNTYIQSELQKFQQQEIEKSNGVYFLVRPSTFGIFKKQILQLVHSCRHIKYPKKLRNKVKYET